MNRELNNGTQHNRSIMPASEVRRVITEQLEKLRQRDKLAAQGTRSSPEEIDFPRVCAVHDRCYVARYVSNGNGQIKLSQTIRLTDALWDEYEQSPKIVRTMSNEVTTDETCPWCGTKGYGAIHCDTCNTDICWGRTGADRIFHCSDSCGATGALVPGGSRDMHGLARSPRGTALVLRR